MSQGLRVVSGGISAARGFLGNGLSCGIKRTGRLDLALVWSTRVCKAAAVFTRNRFKAHPVRIDMKRAQRGEVQAALINSGNANCLTGRRGFQQTLRLSKRAARALKIPEHRLWIYSTGVIGVPLPTEKIEAKLPVLIKGLSRKGAQAAAQGILTTDRVRKQYAVRFQVGGKTITLGGMTKGAGMIQPNMATMLAFITTDAVISRGALQKALRSTTNRTFNRITVDGQMSTNDSVLLMANGLADNRPIGTSGPGFRAFQSALDAVCAHLAEMIVADGEGVTRIMRLRVTGARTREEAERVAKGVVNSSLVKTMIRGADPNWGRLLQATGASLVPFKPNRVGIYFGSYQAFASGERIRIPTEKVRRLFKKRVVPIRIELGRGSSEVEMIGADLSEVYVRVNAHYFT